MYSNLVSISFTQEFQYSRLLSTLENLNKIFKYEIFVYTMTNIVFYDD